MKIDELARPLDGAAVSAFLRSLPTQPLLLGLGEARHGVEALLELRNEIFRHLVEHEGYRSFAIESDCLMGLVVDGYVATGAGSLDDVMDCGFSHGFGAYPANRELVRWMRAYNEEHGETLRFFGVDAPLEISGAASPRQALTGLYGYLAERLDPSSLPCTPETLDELLGPDDRWANPAAAMDPSQSIGRSADAQRLRLIADDLVAFLDAHAPQLAGTDEDLAALYGRTATGLLRYHHWIADTSPARLTWLMSLRDQMMAENLRAVAGHGPALVFAHNRHLQRDKSFLLLGDAPVEWWSAGAIAGMGLGDRYAFLASAFGTVGGDTPPPDTVEGLLSEAPPGRSIVDARRLAETVAEPSPRVSRDFAYFPLDPAQLHLIDGIVFLKETGLLD
ncbi:erythromycin esterase family protein [Microbispora sp. NBC_01189]|uniref:erythromycin esterase family protein n=1 Tax=Microbispora sp. NBC_01189 TaxID=2903583 RepID=UPI002E13F19C|nr:erythromycin esterase family protein [Microbispora sp. NBC_01189]